MISSRDFSYSTTSKEQRILTFTFKRPDEPFRYLFLPFIFFSAYNTHMLLIPIE